MTETELSIVVPIHNEAESIPELLRQIREAIDPTEYEYEVILVDDGSTDESWDLIRAHETSFPRLTGIKLASNLGQTPALMAGFDASHGQIVVTLDGDLQNDPADIPKLIHKLNEGYEIVSGWRKDRKDRLFSRRFPSVVANRISRMLTGLTIHDNGCALKAYRGELLRSVSLYSEFHRFIVPLAQIGGGRVAEVVTHHRARQYGVSKYGLERIFKVAADLITLYMITRYAHRLLIWFLVFAIPIAGLAIVALIWTYYIVAFGIESPLLVPIASAVVLFQSACAIISYGFFAERIRHLAPRTGESRLLVSESSGGAETTMLVGGEGFQTIQRI